jgi:hypothetical protein
VSVPDKLGGSSKEGRDIDQWAGKILQFNAAVLKSNDIDDKFMLLPEVPSWMRTKKVSGVCSGPLPAKTDTPGDKSQRRLQTFNSNGDNMSHDDEEHDDSSDKEGVKGGTGGDEDRMGCPEGYKPTRKRCQQCSESSDSPNCGVCCIPHASRKYCTLPRAQRSVCHLNLFGRAWLSHLAWCQWPSAALLTNQHPAHIFRPRLQPNPPTGSDHHYDSAFAKCHPAALLLLILLLLPPLLLHSHSVQAQRWPQVPLHAQ